MKPEATAKFREAVPSTTHGVAIHLAQGTGMNEDVIELLWLAAMCAALLAYGFLVR